MLNGKNHTVFKSCLFVALLFLQTGLATAQTKMFTLADALQTAEANYPVIKAKILYARSAEQSLKETRREFIPALKLTGEVNYATANSLPGLYFPYGIVPSISGSINAANNNTAVYGAIGLASFEWVPFSFGQYRAKLNESKINLDYANADVEQEKFYDKIYVCEAYLNLLAAARLRIAEEHNVTRAETIKGIVTNAAKNGLRPGVDSSFANSELSKARLALMEATKNEEDQKTFLANLLGMQTQEYVLDTTNFFKAPTAIEAVKIDIANNPLLKTYNIKVLQSESREEEISRAWYPKISLLGAAFGRGSGISYKGVYDPEFGDGTSMQRFNYAAGAAATFNILDYPRMRAQLNAERFKTQAIKSEYDDQNIKLSNQLLLAERKLQLSVAEAKEAPVQYSAASDAYRQKLALYNAGLVNITDVAQTLYNLNKAEADLTLVNDGVWKSLLYKASVAGDLGVILNNIK